VRGLRSPSGHLDVQLLLGRQLLRALGTLPTLAATVGVGTLVATHVVRRLDAWLGVPELAWPTLGVTLAYSLALFVADDLSRYLGPERFHTEVAERIRRPGIATGVAWTPAGGDILFVEASLMPGKGSLLLTGQLGDVMRESAQAALTYLRSTASDVDLAPDMFQKHDLHVHVPAGAVPKDGPSAGVTMYTALISLLTGRVVRHDVAMTGEITLRGMVLPVGGIKEKVLAAQRSGLKRFILPEKNRPDLEEIPARVRDRMTFHFVSEMSELDALVLAPVGRRGASGRKTPSGKRATKGTSGKKSAGRRSDRSPAKKSPARKAPARRSGTTGRRRERPASSRA